MTPLRYLAVRHGLLVGGLVVMGMTVWSSLHEPAGAFDARAYWDAARGDMYARPVLGTDDAYYYSPAFQQVFSPILGLTLPLFLGIWELANAAALVLVMGWALPFALLFAFVPIDLAHGNIEPLLAFAIVVGFRYPAAWSFVLLTKVTPGIGLLWFAVRREWGSLGIALGATGAIAAASFLVAPDLWAQWLTSLIGNAGRNALWAYFPFPFGVRFLLAAVVVAVGARRNWRWAVPVGATLAMPVLWPVNLTVLVAVIPLVVRSSPMPFGTLRQPIREPRIELAPQGLAA